jgi:TNF receptor-associated factor 4
MVLKELSVPGTSALFFHSTKRDRVVFVEEISPQLVCPACDDVFEDPHAAPCGHSVCLACIPSTAGQTGRCFSCAQPADPDDFAADSVLAIRVGDARCFCRNAIGIKVLEDATNRRTRSLASDSGGSSVASKKPRIEVYVRKDDFHETACSRSVALRDLDDHEAACEFQTLMCDLCDEEEDEEVDVRLSANLSPGKESLDTREPGDDGLASDSGGAGSKDGTSAETNAPVSPPKKKPPPAPCGFACLRRDMPSHMAECGHRQVDCPYGTNGKTCRWRGAARRARTKHAETCVAAPRPCPNKCGLRVSAEDLEKHKATTCSMQEIACGAPDAEAGQGGPDGKHRSWCDARCPAKIKRVDLGKHRREFCDYARAAKCRLCRELVSLRSAGSHASERCSRARRACPNECGVTLPLGEHKLEAHLNEVCLNAPAECPYASLGCVPAKRLTRRTREEHLRHATGAHAELIRVGLVAAKSRSDAFRKEVDDHRVTLSADAEKTRAEASAYLDARLADAAAAADAARAEDSLTRDALRAESAALGAAMSDLGATTSGRMLELFDDIRALRHDFESFKRASETQISLLRKAVDKAGDGAQALFEEVGKQRDDAVGAHHALVTRALEEEKDQWRADIDVQARALREDLEAYKLGVNAKMRDAWDAIRAAGRKF